MSESFTYDPLGNRLDHITAYPSTSTLDLNSSTTVEAYETNELNQYTQITQADDADTDPTVNREPGTVNFVHDDNGNLTADGSQQYTYDAQNRLVEVASATKKAVFTYDARNRCVLRQYYTADANGVWLPDNTNSVAMTYDTDWNILADRNLSGRQTAIYIHGTCTDEILAQVRGSGVLYPLADASNSTIALADQNGSSAAVCHYTAFGKAYGVSGAASDYRYLFTGREWLAPVGLSEHRNRYYNPNTGRWLSPDSTHYSDGYNLYAAFHNDPNDLSDPFGTSCADLNLTSIINNPDGSTTYRDPDGSSVTVGPMTPVAYQDPSTGRWYDWYTNTPYTTPPAPNSNEYKEIQRLEATINNNYTSHNEAIIKTIASYHINTQYALGNRVLYCDILLNDKGEPVDGVTMTNRAVLIGPGAFSSPSWLASTIGHEVEAHCQYDTLYGKIFDSYRDASAMREVYAYDYELRNQARFGTTAAEIAAIQRERDREYNSLSNENKTRVNNGNYKPAP
jgi:RHS repeat-associated protein